MYILSRTPWLSLPMGVGKSWEDPSVLILTCFFHQGRRDLDFPSNLMSMDTTKGESQLLALYSQGLQ